MIDVTATLRGLTIGAGTPYRWERWPTGLLDTADIRSRDEPLPRRDGLIAGRDLLGGHGIAFEVVVMGSSRADCESKLADLRAAFTGGPADEQLDVRVSGTPSEYAFFGRPRGVRVPLGRTFNGGVASARCTFMATDPVAYGAEMVEVIGLAAHPLPETLPFILGVYDSEVFSSAGTAPVDRWTVILEAVGGDLIDPSIAHADTGQLIFHDLTMTVGETLVIDGHERRALLNGVTPVVPTIAQWWRIVSGSNEVRFAASPASSLSSTATLTWRPGWS
jgi:hypothetical protein